MGLSRRDIAIAAVLPFIAWGFATHWVPILRLLGYAYIAGLLSSLAAVGLVVLLTVQRKKFPQSKAFPPPQTAAFVDPVQWQAATAWLTKRRRYNKRPLFPSSLVLSDSLDEILDWIIRDFVSSWYSGISRTPDFGNQIDYGIRLFLDEIKRRLESHDVVDVLVLRLAPLFTSHLRDFHEAELKVRGKSLNRNVTESEELDMAIAGRFKGGNLHPAASLLYSDTRVVQQEYLREMVARIIPAVLPSDWIQSKAVFVLVREIVSCAIMCPLMQILSDPDVWNQILEAYGRTMLQERKTVRKLRAALDEHASPVPKASKPYVFPKLSSSDDERKFERFIRAIRQCNNLSDARRFRSEVASQLKRESMLEDHDRIYLRRLVTGKRILDQRVGTLSAVGCSAKKRSQIEAKDTTKSSFSNATLREVLSDASGLSYFMEYMDRQGLVTLVQFWIVVDGFRNPLEDDTVEDANLGNHQGQWTESDRMDVAQISEAYLSKPEIDASAVARKDVQEFLEAGENASPAMYSKARGAILTAQTAILETMQQKHYPKFRQSDLFYKLLTSDDAPQKSGGHLPRQEPRTSGTKLSADHASKLLAQSRPISRTSSASTVLKRSAASSTDLKSARQDPGASSNSNSRRSLDVDVSAPLFDDDVEPEPLARSTQSLKNGSLDGEKAGGNEARMVEAIEAALNTIMTDDPRENETQAPYPEYRDADQLFEKDTSLENPFSDSGKSDSRPGKRDRPNLASLGLVNTSSRIGVFKDDDLFGDEDKFLEDEHADPDGQSEDKEVEEEVKEAVPGDLGLAEAISALTVDIDRLAAQESIVDTLTRKAELTNNLAELRILGKSKSSLQREIRLKELQRQQYIVQESDNSLYGRASINIKSIMVGKEEDGQEFALYVIEVQRVAGEHMPAASWAIARRYSEFHDLHQRLRRIYPAVRQLDFPRRRLVMKLQRDFLHRRRISLENYLRALLRLPAVCRSRDLRAFLSQRPIMSKEEVKRDGERPDIVSRIYNSVTDGMDEFLGNIPVLDQLSMAGQNLISAATSQYYNSPAPIPSDDANRIQAASVEEAQAELEAFESPSLEPFVKPICDLFLETFELNRSQNWLRGRAVVVVLHQLLGGTIERKVRESAKMAVSDNNLLKYLALVKEGMWPGGILQRERKPRTAAMKKNSRKEASVVLATLIPELAGGVVGRSNAHAAGRRLFATANNARLNSHLAFQLLDELVAILFPDVRGQRQGFARNWSAT